VAETNKDNVVKSIFERRPDKDRATISAFLKADSASGRDAPKKTMPVSASLKTFPYGIDIGASAVKFVQLGKAADNSVVINNCGIEEFSAAALADPKVREKELPAMLAKIVKENGITGKIFSSLPAREAKTMLLNLPVMPSHEVFNAIGWTLRNEAHLNLEDHSYDYAAVKNLGTTRESLQSYFTVASPKKSAMTLISLFESLGLIVAAIDVDPIADIEALTMTGCIKKDSSVVLVIALGQDESTLGVAYEGDVYFLRNLTVSGSAFTESLQKSMGSDRAAAESAKRQFDREIERHSRETPAAPPSQDMIGIPAAPDMIPADVASGVPPAAQPPAESSGDGAIESALRENLEILSDGISQSFKFFSFQVTRSAIKNFDRVIFTGGSSLIKPLPSYIKKALETDATVEIADLSGKIGFSEKIVNKLGSEYLTGALPRLITAIGLAQRGLGL
jgi:type IV pilus assembly protein PilM